MWVENKSVFTTAPCGCCIVWTDGSRTWCPQCIAAGEKDGNGRTWAQACQDAARAVRPRVQRVDDDVAEKTGPWGRIEGELTVNEPDQ